MNTQEMNIPTTPVSHPSSPAADLAVNSDKAAPGPRKSVTIQSPPGSKLGLKIACSQSADGQTHIFVNDLAPGSPAAETNAIAAGDRIIEINGQSVTTWRLEWVCVWGFFGVLFGRVFVFFLRPHPPLQLL
jgi:hypothetical protein